MFELTDHLGNVKAVIAKSTGSSAVEVLSYSDYYPHGGVLPGRNFVSSPSYKQGYQGKEKDPETNFTNFDLRQFDPRLGRWFNPDPMGQYFSPYLAMGNNPVSSIDPTGGYNTSLDADLEGIYEDRATNYSKYSEGDLFFAIDKFNASRADYSNSGEILQNYYDNKEGSQLAIHNLMNPDRPNQPIVDPEQLKRDCPQCNDELLPEVTISGGGMSYDVHKLVQLRLDNWRPCGELSLKDKMKMAGPVAYYMHGVANGLYDAGEAAVLFGARDIFMPETWKNMGNLAVTLSVVGVGNGDFGRMADGISKKIRDADLYDLGHFEGVVGFGIIADKGLGLVGEAGAAFEGATGLTNMQPARSLGAAAKKGARIEAMAPKSINQLNKMIQKGQTPKGIKRFDAGKNTLNLPMDEATFMDNSSLYKNGTWRHNNGHVITNEQSNFLRQNGWTIP